MAAALGIASVRHQTEPENNAQRRLRMSAIKMAATV